VGEGGGISQVSGAEYVRDEEEKEVGVGSECNIQELIWPAFFYQSPYYSHWGFSAPGEYMFHCFCGIARSALCAVGEHLDRGPEFSYFLWSMYCFEEKLPYLGLYFLPSYADPYCFVCF